MKSQAREKLKGKIWYHLDEGVTLNDATLDFIVDFIERDRKRILEPLVKERRRPDTHLADAMNAIDEAITLAGMEDA